jgi:hypothetical protein
MQILLRNYKDKEYVWMQAKYDKGKFVVDGINQNETNVVSIINDNRKNYVQCSNCGKVFRKRDHKFKTHKEDAKSSKVCLTCPHVICSNNRTITQKYIANEDGTYVRKIEQRVDLQCSSGYLWTYPSIDSITAIEGCKLRQCGDATEKEIEDTFTQYPGIFDDIITVDKILDFGYVGIPDRGISYTLYDLNIADSVCAYVNKLGIVDKFFLCLDDYTADIWYSKKYKEIFTCDKEGHYIPWAYDGLSTRKRIKIKEAFEKLYR